MTLATHRERSTPARVLVTGASGLLGHTVVEVLRRAGHHVITHARESAADLHADLSDEGATHRLLENAAADVVVNLAAWTDVDGCEREPDRAYRVNTRSVENLASWIARAGTGAARTHLVHISTDQVYDGAGPHAEADLCLRNCYAFSKRASELAAEAIGASVLRTNFFGRSRKAGRSSFTDWLFRAMRDRRPIQVFDDVLFSPLAIDSLADCIAAVVQARPGITMNVGSHDGLSKARFAMAFAEAAGLDTTTTTVVPMAEGPTLVARRPLDMRMDTTRYQHAMNTRLPTLSSEIERIGRSYRAHA